MCTLAGGSDGGDNRPPAACPNQPLGCLCGGQPASKGKYIPGGNGGAVPKGRGRPPQSSEVKGGRSSLLEGRLGDNNALPSP